MRVPTPTASAELVTEFNFKLIDRLKEFKSKILKNMRALMDDLNRNLDFNKSRLKSPLSLLREKNQQLDNLDLRMQQQLKSIITNKKNQIEQIDSQIGYNNPIKRLDLIKNKLIQINGNLKRNINEKILLNKNTLEKFLKNIEILSPLSILERGYAIVTNSKGEAVKSYDDVDKGEILKTRLNEGSLDVEVIKNEK